MNAADFKALEARLAAARFKLGSRELAAPQLVDLILSDQSRLAWASISKAVAPACDAIIVDIPEDDRPQVEYSWRVAVADADSRGNKKIYRDRITPDDLPDAGILASEIEFSAGFQSEGRLPAPLWAVIHLHGLLASMDRLPMRSPKVEREVFRGFLQWFRIAFEIPFLWDHGYRRGQSHTGGKDTAVKIALVRGELGKGYTDEAVRAWAMKKWCIGKSTAYDYVRKAKAGG